MQPPFIIHNPPLYFRLENWDVRASNIDKQAHLLTAAELKRRGITRYDAEIILASGIQLPEPRKGSSGPKPMSGRRLRAKQASGMDHNL